MYGATGRTRASGRGGGCVLSGMRRNWVDVGMGRWYRSPDGCGLALQRLGGIIDVMRYAKRRPGPWSFHTTKYGLRNVVIDANQEPVASNVPPESGPLVASAPDLLKALETVAEKVPVGSPAWHTATEALEAERVAEEKAVEGSSEAALDS